MTIDTNGRAATPPALTPPASATAKKAGRFGAFKPYLAPILITLILAAGNLQYRVLESYWYTMAAIMTAILAETALSRFATGRWPHFASAYITGISVGILLRTPMLWPYIMCSLLSITSKYALRVGGRHLWNPSNLGVSTLLLIIPQAVAPLSQQWGNESWVLLIIACLGAAILYSLGRLHITLTYVVAFTVLSGVRSAVAGRVWISEIGLLTAPAYQLFMFFMITDPKTTPRTKPRQIAVTIVVAVVETVFRLFENTHAPYYALFVVFPISNLIEIFWDRRHGPSAATAVAKEAISAGRSRQAPYPSEVPGKP
jgi:enediyne biosynthesis protein E5